MQERGESNPSAGPGREIDGREGTIRTPAQGQEPVAEPTPEEPQAPAPPAEKQPQPKRPAEEPKER